MNLQEASGPVRELLQLHPVTPRYFYDVSSDGQRFLVNAASECEVYRVCRRAHSERGWGPWDGGVCQVVEKFSIINRHREPIYAAFATSFISL